MTSCTLGTENRVAYFLPAKSLDSLDVDDKPPTIIELASAQHHAQLLATLRF